MRQTFLCEVYDFPPNVRILVKAFTSQCENGSPPYFQCYFQQQGGSREPRPELGIEREQTSFGSLLPASLRQWQRTARSLRSTIQPNPRRIHGVLPCFSSRRSASVLLGLFSIPHFSFLKNLMVQIIFLHLAFMLFRQSHKGQARLLRV